MGIKTTGKFYTNAVAPIAVGAGGTVGFTNSVISNNCLALVNNGIQIKASGLYRVLATVTLTGTAIGDVTANLQANGIDIAGASASGSFIAVGDLITLPLETLITVTQSNAGSYATITLELDNASSYTISQILIEKVA